MEPRIADGDTLMIDKSDRDVKDGRVYVLRYGGDRIQKRISLIAQKSAIQENQVVNVRGGTPAAGGGTWLHPKLAIPFADWLDPEFGYWCDEQIEKILKGELIELPAWRRNIQDRLDHNSVPLGMPYFDVFRELLDVTHALMREGLAVDPGTVLDISVGRRWAKHWVDSGLEVIHTEKRMKWPHTYPQSYPQSAANGHIEAYVYPISAVADFRGWLAQEYLPKHFPQYIRGKAKKGELASTTAAKLIEAVNDSLYKITG